MTGDVLRELVRRQQQLERGADTILEVPTRGAGAYAKAISLHLGIPGLRSYWPGSVVSTTPTLQDLSPFERHLSVVGTPQCGMGTYAAYVDFTAGEQYRIADTAAHDLTGAETYIVAANRGVTFGCWVRPTRLTASEAIMGKWSNAGQLSYRLALFGASAGDPFAFSFSDDGTNQSDLEFTSPAVIDMWQQVICRFRDQDSGEEVAIFVNGVKVTGSTSYASIHSGTDGFALAGLYSGAWDFAGRISNAWLSCMGLSDAFITMLYATSRGLYT